MEEENEIVCLKKTELKIFVVLALVILLQIPQDLPFFNKYQLLKPWLCQLCIIIYKINEK